MVKDRDYDDKKDEPTKKLSQDFDSPFSEPPDAKHRMPVDYPAKDSKTDDHERYDEGEDAAAVDDDPHDKRGGTGGARKLF